jgi:hypothetical protein
MAYNQQDYTQADLKRIEKLLENAVAFLDDEMNTRRPSWENCANARQQIGVALGYVSTLRMTL